MNIGYSFKWIHMSRTWRVFKKANSQLCKSSKLTKTVDGHNCVFHSLHKIHFQQQTLSTSMPTLTFPKKKYIHRHLKSLTNINHWRLFRWITRMYTFNDLPYHSKKRRNFQEGNSIIFAVKDLNSGIEIWKGNGPYIRQLNYPHHSKQEIHPTTSNY